MDRLDSLLPSAGAVSARLVVTAATGEEQIAQCQQWLGQQHFLGPAKTAGQRLFQIVYEDQNPVAVLVWAASAWHLKDRDTWIDWDPLTRARRLNLIVSNWRFLVFEDSRRPNLASQCLGAALRVLQDQWERLHGYRPLLAESFTDPEAHAGTCYKAAGWQPLGFSKGFGRHHCDFYLPNDRPKKLWVKELQADARQLLTSKGTLPEAHAAGESAGHGVRSPIKADQLRSLSEAFRRIPDPRPRANMRYPLPAVLTIMATALLSGAVHITELCRAGQRLNQQQRAQIGLRRKPGTKFYPAPSYAVYRDLLGKLDLGTMAGVFNIWLDEHQGILPRSLAMDGKTIVNKLGQMVSLVDQENGVPVAMVTNNEGDELPAAQELLAREEVCLINRVVTADALHCQRESAHQIVTAGGDYLLRIKGNQPHLLERAETLLSPEVRTPLFRQSKRATDASKSVP